MMRPFKVPPTIAILVILFWIGWLGLFALFGSPCSPANQTREEADLRAIRSALMTYRMNAGHYPSTEQGLEALVSRPAADPIPKRWTRIVDTLPEDPWGNPYHYRLLSQDGKQPFEVFSAGKDRVPGTGDDLSFVEERRENKPAQLRER